MAEQIKDLRISTIKIGKQFRHDLGDLRELAESARQGLLQPIVVKPDRKLVFGYRRLVAYRDILHRKTIPARVMDVPSIFEGALTENLMRKDYSISERVAIFQAVKAAFGDRQGQRTDLQPRGKSPEVKPGERTDDYAARKAGLGNRKTAAMAERVVECGIPELVTAMDQGEIAISAAAEAASLAANDQRSLLQRRDGAKLTAQQVRKCERLRRMMRQGEKALKEIPHIANGSTIICNDALVELDQLAEESVGLVCTSPPYYNARPEYGCYESYDHYLNFLRAIIRKCHRVLADGRFFVMVIAPVLVGRQCRDDESVRLPIPFDVHRIFDEEGYDFLEDIIWEKPDGAGGQRGKRFAADRNPLAYKPVPVTEYVLVYRKKSERLIDDLIAAVDPAVRRRLEDEHTNVWRISPARSDLHPAPFPLELAERIVRYYSFVGDVVLDPLAGTGTTGLAAQNLKRRFCLIERKRQYLLGNLPAFPNAARKGF